MDWLNELWDWFIHLNVGEQAGVAGALIAGLAFLWSLYTHFSKRKSSTPSENLTASQGGIAAGGDITAKTSGDGITVFSSGGPVTIQQTSSGPTPAAQTPSGNGTPRTTSASGFEAARYNDKAQRTQVFISYSHQDKAWLERLQVHLKPLEREGRIDRWDDTRIKPGEKWQEEIEKAMVSAKVAVLLVSADFLASDFIADNELPPLLSAAEADGARILSVIVRPCRFTKTRDLAQYQSVNPPDKPLSKLSGTEQEEFLVKVTEAIENSVNP